MSQLLQGRTAHHDALLDFGYSQLDFEVARMLFGQFVQTEEDWFQARQFSDLTDLLVQDLQLVERILVFRSHDAILPYPSFRLRSALLRVPIE